MCLAYQGGIELSEGLDKELSGLFGSDSDSDN